MHFFLFYVLGQISTTPTHTQVPNQHSNEKTSLIRQQQPPRPPNLAQIGRQPRVRVHPSKGGPKNFANLKFHAYYLEGGWGYLIVMCAFLTNVICQGVQFSTSILASRADRRFRMERYQFGVYSGGKFLGFHAITYFYSCYTTFGDFHVEIWSTTTTHNRPIRKFSYVNVAVYIFCDLNHEVVMALD